MKRRNFLKDTARWLLFGGLVIGIGRLASHKTEPDCTMTNTTCRDCPVLFTCRRPQTNRISTKTLSQLSADVPDIRR